MISKKSSSFHIFSGDNNPGIVKKILWLIINLIINKVSSFYPKDRDLKYDYFKNLNINILKKIKRDYTPSRKLSDFFWYNLPVNQILKNFEDINILDIGCGNGNYYYIFKEIFGDKLKSYTGFDRKLRVDDYILNRDNTNFIEDDVKNIKKYLKNYNLIISQSFIEHINWDISFFEDLKYYEELNIPNLQIHLFPSNPCLYTYLSHGIRHYNLGSVSKISNIYDSLKTKKTLLGFGYNCINSLHFRELTLKKIFRSKNLIEEKKLEIYNNKFLEAFQKDMKDCKKNKINNAAFYGFILQTNLKKEIIFNNK